MSSSGLSARLASSTTERPLVREAVLRQVADRQRVGTHDAARVRLVEPGQHAQQRRLAGAVRSAQPDAIAIADLPGDASSSTRSANALCELLKLNHARSVSWRQLASCADFIECEHQCAATDQPNHADHCNHQCSH